MPIDRDLKDQVEEEEIICNQKWLSDTDADMIVEILKKDKVKKMALANNDLGEEAAEKIVEALLGNTSLKWLSLSSNKFGDAGCLKFARVLTENTTLETLFLMGNKTTEKTDDELWAANASRSKPMPENLYGLVLEHKSPAARAREEEKKAEKKKKSG